MQSDRLFLGVCVAALLLGAPLVLPADWLGILILTLLFVVFALGLQIVVGLCNLLNLGSAGFICIGAYVTAILMKSAGWNYWAAAVGATLAAMFAGVLLGLPTLRLHGDYFAVATFGFSELVVLLVRNWPRLTGGALGLGGIPNPVFLGWELYRYPPTAYWYLLLALAGSVALFCWGLSRSVLGAKMVAVGDDPLLAETVGIDTTAVKLSAFALSAAICGLGGSFWAVYYKFLLYVDFSLPLSIQVLAIVVLANSRSFHHVALAAVVLAPLGELLRVGLRHLGAPETGRFIFYGVVLVGIVVFRNWARKHGRNP